MDEEQIEKIRKSDILTDFDRVMIKEQSHYMQLYSYYSSLKGFYERVNFTKKLIKGFYCYNITKDVGIFYSLLKGCPVEVLNKIASKFHRNRGWDLLIEELEHPKVGIISRNHLKVITDYLDKFEQPTKINIIAANIPEIKNNIYTGRVKINVNNKNLENFVRKKDYICGEERKLLNNFEFTSKKVGHRLWICSKRKIFKIL